MTFPVSEKKTEGSLLLLEKPAGAITVSQGKAEGAVTRRHQQRRPGSASLAIYSAEETEYVFNIACVDRIDAICNEEHSFLPQMGTDTVSLSLCRPSCILKSALELHKQRDFNH